MGLILDSSVLVATERQGRTVYAALAEIARSQGDIEVGISAITVVELAHGTARAETSQRKEKRLRFIQEIASAVPIYPVTATIAFRAGLIDGEAHAKGVRVALSDLLIGVTALELGFGVGTGNLRDFGRIPGLSVVQL
ncbi:MAG TPA: PIN domain-containing protein [Terriglobales bacterium]|nr:PIN domain-containing protein [Terriglobales bacterium]